MLNWPTLKAPHHFSLPAAGSKRRQPPCPQIKMRLLVEERGSSIEEDIKAGGCQADRPRGVPAGLQISKKEGKFSSSYESSIESIRWIILQQSWQEGWRGGGVSQGS
mmetsp:Transcript_27238/g.40080  ORF Transcript_27238/g.40080 Transcript_27238/m.40080 type:complete len:107 (-) Transcript_27238:46-366(-)